VITPITITPDHSRLGENVGTARDTITAVLNVKQAAEFLGLTPARVRKLAQVNRITAVKVGRDWIFKQGDLDRFARIPRDVGPPTKAERRKYDRLRAAVKP
jgi:excisionase family DNA binding protein